MVAGMAELILETTLENEGQQMLQRPSSLEGKKNRLSLRLPVKVLKVLLTRGGVERPTELAKVGGESCAESTPRLATSPHVLCFKARKADCA